MAALSLVPSPCVSVCTMDLATGWCRGCARTLDEIAAWSRLDDMHKRAVWRLLPARRAELLRLNVLALPPQTGPSAA